MKKLLLLITILSWTYYSYAQCDNTLPVYEDFSNSTEVNLCWTFIDADNDGWGWMNTDMGGGNKGLRSHSFIGYALSPNNWAISNAIDLTSANETLSWRVRATDWDFDKEKYTVYVATGNQISDFESSSLFLTENLDNTDASGQFASRSLDISSFAGQTVYVAFRHHNVSDQWSIDIDDFMISSSALGVEDFNKENFKFFYTKDTQSLIVKSVNNPISSVKIYNILGQTVVNKTSSDYNENLNLSGLVDGMYIAQVEIDNTIKSIKFLKR